MWQFVSTSVGRGEYVVMSGPPLPNATRPCSSMTVPQSAVTPPCSASTIPLFPYHWAAPLAPGWLARKTIAIEKADAPPTGLSVEVSQWRLKRTTEPPTGVAFLRRLGCKPGDPATTRLL